MYASVLNRYQSIKRQSISQIMTFLYNLETVLTTKERKIALFDFVV